MKMKKPDYTLLDHTADLGIIVKGNDLPDLFESAALAMTQIMVRQKKNLNQYDKIEISISGEDLADLMVQWLGEILYLFEGEKSIFVSSVFDIISSSRLKAIVKITPFDPNADEVLTEIKAVTYHQSQVNKVNSHWEARIIFDL